MKTVKDFISTLMVAISNCSLYTKEHEAFSELAQKTLSTLGEILDKRFEMMVIENELIVNKTPFTEAGLHRTNLIKRLRRKGISRVDFIEGITLEEMKQFIIDVSGNGKGLKSCPHIKSGTVDISLSSPKGEIDFDKHSLPWVSSGEVDKVKDIFHAASPFRKLNIAGLEEVVVHFITTFKKEAGILKYLSPVKSFSEYTYTHATNVAVLTMFQAESLGIKDDLLHEIGIAALLHDAGKLFVPKEILEKNGKLDDREFSEIKKHPLHGARYLAKMDNLTRLAPLMAFEHHLKYDCSGYPAVRFGEKKQHIFSQIIAIADFFDALRSHRPYRKSMEIKDIIALMKKGSGSDFNPYLINNFIGLLQVAIMQ
jgi:HD-GYP domain-containing protein (c-di-GMP phosphodiesterase class II)